MGPPSGALRECQPRSPRVADRYMTLSNPVQHAQACVGSTTRDRGPRQLAEHSSDAADVVPRDAAPSLISAYCNVCGIPYGGDIFQVRSN